MVVAHKNLEVTDIAQPQGIVKATVCKDSGLLPTELCTRDPRGSRLVTTYFTEGTVPTKMCDIHIEASINKNNGKLATANTPANLIIKKYLLNVIISLVLNYKMRLMYYLQSMTIPVLLLM